MADLTTAQKAPILLDGTPIPLGLASFTSSDDGIVTTQNFTTAGTTSTYAVGVAAGNATITVTTGGRTGSVAVNVSAAPLIITLGAPEPK